MSFWGGGFNVTSDKRHSELCLKTSIQVFHVLSCLVMLLYRDGYCKHVFVLSPRKWCQLQVE